MLEKGIKHLKGADQKEWPSYRNKYTRYFSLKNYIVNLSAPLAGLSRNTKLKTNLKNHITIQEKDGTWDWLSKLTAMSEDSNGDRIKLHIQNFPGWNVCAR